MREKFLNDFFFKFHPITCFSFFCVGFLNIFKPIMKKDNTSSNSSQKFAFDRGEVAPELVSAAILSLVPGGNRTCHCEPCGFQVCTGSRGDRTTCREMGWIGMEDGMGNLLGDLILKFKGWMLDSLERPFVDEFMEMVW